VTARPVAPRGAAISAAQPGLLGANIRPVPV